MKTFLLTMLFFCFINFTLAQSIRLDTGFGKNGIVNTDIGSINSYNNTSRQVMIDAQDRMYVLINSVFISRRFATGKIDSSYGFNGFSQSVHLDNAYGALQKDGKIVLVGTRYNQTTFLVARLDSSGFIDSSFGNKGFQSTDFTTPAFANSVTVADDGKIVVAGYTLDNNNNNYFALARYTSTGNADLTFNGTGKAITDFPYTPIVFGNDPVVTIHNAVANTVAVQPNGKIIVAGYAYINDHLGFAIARYTKAGLLDNSFGIHGIQTTNIGNSNSTGYSLALQTDNKIILAGYTMVGNDNNFAAVRYDSTGKPDDQFNGNGIQIANTGADMIIGNSVTLQKDGKIIMAGYSGTAFNHDFALVRLNKNGSFDNSFGTGGILTTDINSSDDYAGTVVIQSTDKIVVAGNATSNNISNFALVRYNDNGTTDNTFGSGGKVIGSYQQGNTRYFASAIQTDGKIVAAGFTFNGTNLDFAVCRYKTNGFMDSSFNGTGKQITDFGGKDQAASLVILPNGKIVVAGETDNSDDGTNAQFAVARYNKNGTIDNTFGDHGKLFLPIGFGDNLAAVLLQKDGKLVLVGKSSSDVDFTSTFFTLARIDSNGEVDKTFNGTGVQLTDFGSSYNEAMSAVLQTNGLIVAAGRAYINGVDNFALARYKTDGTLDNSFGNNGKQLNVFGSDNYFAQAVAVQTDGKIVAAGYSQSADGSISTFEIARYLNNGQLDNTFANQGNQSINLGIDFNIATAIAIKNDGRIAVGGYNDNYSIVLLKSNGTRDSTFGNNGIQINTIGAGFSYIYHLVFDNNALYATGTASFPGANGVVAKYIFPTKCASPATVTDFTATLNNKTVALQWHTVNEPTLKGFTLLRSADSSNFIPVGYIAAQKSAAVNINYSVIDKTPLKGINFYKLQIADSDSALTYSKVVSVITNDTKAILKVFPNPAQSTLFALADGKNERATFKIINASGRNMQQVEVVLNGPTTTPIDVIALPKGIYLLQMMTVNKVNITTFIKK